MRPTYRSDPRWIAARDRLIAEDGTASENYLRSLFAAVEMFRIETEHENHPTVGGGMNGAA